MGTVARNYAYPLSNTKIVRCHGFFSLKLLLSLLFAVLLAPVASLDFGSARAQEKTPSAAIEGAGPYEPPPLPKPDFKTRPIRPDAPPAGEYNFTSDSQLQDGDERRLIGHAVIEGAQLVIKADEIDYNEATGDAEARGHVYFQQFERSEIIVCARMIYNTETQKGKYYNVKGYTKTRIETRPGYLTSDNPFYFEGEWAERIGEKYILYNGWITGCNLPNPWWSLKAPKFDIIPEQRALAYKAVFRLRRIPLLYAPVFYKSLEKEPRQSGFLTPNIGNSSSYGFMVGLGYYWAINRSYDVTYRFIDFTSRGYAHHIDFRAKPTQKSDFDVIFYGVQDRGIQSGNTVQKQGGFDIYATGKIDLGSGWTARGNLNYVSSLLFRQSFTQSFNEAVFSESKSTGFLSKHFDSYTFNAVFSRVENFQDVAPNDYIIIRKLPEFEFLSRDRELFKGLPIWGSFDTSYGLLYRTQPASTLAVDNGPAIVSNKLQTSQFSQRGDAEPRVMTVLRFLHFNLVPSFTLHETYYNQQIENGRVTNAPFVRSAREISLDLIAPTIERVFNKKTFLGDKLKHVIEPRATYRYITGVTDYERVIRFDARDLLTDTNQLELSLTNRVYAKRGDDIQEVFTWELKQDRYFDPTFGGALLPNQRNVVLSTVDLTGYAFLNQPRSYSPVVSVMRAKLINGFNVDWRADYDPLVGKLVNSGFSIDFRKKKYFFNAGHNHVNSNPVLTPSADQLRTEVGYGDPNRRGWNTAVTAIYDYKKGYLQYSTAQVNYNTDCCGISVQYRRFAFGTRNENQFRLAFSIANVGSFGNLKKQERLF